MPEMNGLEATKAIRAAELKAGMGDCLPKPVCLRVLMTKMNNWLNKSAEDHRQAG